MEPFKDKATAETLASANAWVAKRQISPDYVLARIVTERPWTAEFVEVPKASLAFFRKPHDFFVIYAYSAKDKSVEFAGFWPFDLKLSEKAKTYTNIRLYNSKRLNSLPVKPAKYELKADPQPLKAIAVQPTPAVQPVPAYFDLETDEEVMIHNFERAIRRRAAAYVPTTEPDIEFMQLSTPESAMHNKLSFIIGSLSMERKSFIKNERQLLFRRLTGCSVQTKMVLYQQLLPQKRKRIPLRKPATGMHWEFDERGYETMLMSDDKVSDLDKQLEGFAREWTFIEMPFEEVPKRAMKTHDIILSKGQAFVPTAFLDELITWWYRRKIHTLPVADKHFDLRMRSLIRFWDRLTQAPTETSLKGIDAKTLVKPDCVSVTLTEYPNVENRKFLSNYLARLSLPIELVFQPLQATIAKKYPTSAKQKQVEVQRELKQWHSKSKSTDYHSCETLLLKGKCPFFKPGMKPLDAISKCWGNLQVHGKKTPMAFTRARVQQPQAMNV